MLSAKKMKSFRDRGHLPIRQVCPGALLLFYFSFGMLSVFLIDFERGGGRKRGRETSICL